MERPDEVWAADIIHLPTAEGWLYLAGVLDLGSRRVVGWAIDETSNTSLPMDALRLAFRQHQPKAGLLHRSDRGCWYASETYRERLAAWNVTPSTSRRGNRYRQRGDGELLEHDQGRNSFTATALPAAPRRRARSSTTSKPSTTVSDSTAPSASCPGWNLKSRST